jgi:hypothetical protein
MTMHLINHSKLELQYSVHSKSGVVIAAGTLATGQRAAVATAQPHHTYRIELTHPGAQARHVEERVPGDALVELGLPAEPQDLVQYDDIAYSLYLTGVNQYVSWKYGFAIWAYLYSSPFALYFSGGTGNVLTGDVLRIEANLGIGQPNYLTARGIGDWTVAWTAGTFYPSTWDFQIWLAGSTTSGQTISLGDDIQLISQASGGWAGNALMQRADAPSYLTIDQPSSSAQMTFQVLTSSGGTVASDADIKPAPLPADTERDERIPMSVRISHPVAPRA